MEENKQMITRPLETIEGEILFYKQQTAVGIMEIGKRLIEAKTQVPKGEWTQWLKEKVYFTTRTAQRFMRCATEFSNTTSTSHIGTGKLFELLDVPIDEREEFIATTHEVNGEAKTIEEMTQKELRQAIKEKKEAEKQVEALKQALESEKAKPKEKEIVNNTVTVDNTDYSAKIEAERLKKEKAEILRELENANAEKERLNKQVELEKKKTEIEKERNDFLENAQKEYGDLKKSIELLTQEKDSISRAVSSATELSGLIFNIQSFIKEHLAPIAYSRALREVSDCDVVQENLKDIVGVVKDWCNEIRTYLVRNNTNEETVIVEGIVIE